MSIFLEEKDEVQFAEPILAQKGVRLGVTGIEKTEWKLKKDINVNGKDYAKDTAFPACKIKLTISDDSVKTEHEDSKPKLTLEDQFNLVRYPVVDKKTDMGKMMGRQRLYELEAAFGFDPCFEIDGQPVEPFVTKNGNKVAPKVKGKEVDRKLNPDFFNAYFDNNGEPIMSEWVGKTIYADIKVETSEQYGSKNVIDRYVKAPQI